MAWSLVAAVLVVGLLVYVTMCGFSSQRQMRNSVVVVQSTMWYSVGTKAEKMVFFAAMAPDSTFSGTASTPTPLQTPHFTSGFWANRFALLPSCSGRIVAALPQNATSNGALPTDVNTMIAKTLAKTIAQEKQLKREIRETDYYIRVHGMQDEGFTAVVAYAHKLKMRLAEVRNVKQRLAALNKEKRPRVFRHTRYAVLFGGKMLAATCLREDRQNAMCLLKTTDGQTPWRATVLSALPWNVSAVGEVHVASMPALGIDAQAATRDSAAVWVANVEKDGHLRMHAILGRAGAPVFSTWGRFIGMYNGVGIVPRHVIAQMLWNEK